MHSFIHMLLLRFIIYLYKTLNISPIMEFNHFILIFGIELTILHHHWLVILYMYYTQVWFVLYHKCKMRWQKKQQCLGRCKRNGGA